VKFIKYKKGYKYQLDKYFSIQTEIFPEIIFVVGAETFLSLDQQGLLRISAGYAWDGPSGPTFDTDNFMRASLVHDALYQLMRQRLISRDNRLACDRLLQKMCIEDGMSWIRAQWVFAGVHWFADRSSDPLRAKKVLMAP